MLPNPTLAGAIHAALAPLCIGVGLTQFLRSKRGAGHTVWAATRGRGWLARLAATVTVTAIGYVIIARNRPIPDQDAPVASQMQQDGVPS